MASIDITAANIQAVPTNLTQVVQQVVLTGQTPNPTVLSASVTTIDQAIADIAAANTAGNTALPAPDNFRFFDQTVNVGGSVTGDHFKGATPGIVGQFLDLTPDTVGIGAITPNQFLSSDTANDVLYATGGRNILNGGSGANTFVGGTATPTTPSVDTFISDASKTLAVSTIFNFHSGDDAAMLGLTAADYHLSLKDTFVGLEIDAAPVTAGKPLASVLLQGYTTADVGTKLTIGFSVTPQSTPFLFVHGN